MLATLPERYASGQSISLQDACSMVGLVKGHRAREIAKGSQQELCLGDEASFSLQHRTPKKRKLEETKVMPAVGPLDVWSLNASHSRMLLAALAREAMKCYRIKEADAGFQLLTNDNVNVFPGFRNHGNTCWLNAILQCCMHTRPLRDEILREREVVTSLQACSATHCSVILGAGQSSASCSPGTHRCSHGVGA